MIRPSRKNRRQVEAIILADEMNANLLIMDDNAAKKTAKYLGYNVTGILGVLVKSKEKGYIELVSPLKSADRGGLVCGWENTGYGFKDSRGE